MKSVNYYIVVVIIASCAFSVVGMLAYQTRLLKVIAERPEVTTLVTDDGNIAHGEQKADNNVTIMFNYE